MNQEEVEKALERVQKRLDSLEKMVQKVMLDQLRTWSLSDTRHAYMQKVSAKTDTYSRAMYRLMTKLDVPREQEESDA